MAHAGFQDIVNGQRQTPDARHRSLVGFTLPEMLIVLTIVGLVMAIAIPNAKAGLDRLSARAAASDVRATLNYARMLAMAGGIAVAVDIDSVAGTLRVRRGNERILMRGVGQAHGVRVGKTRDSLAYDPRGLGRGAANLSILLRRGVSVETVFVSRLGRVR
jgi:prepilin-type N-terminal cleavage/methylation domain-containing protein